MKPPYQYAAEGVRAIDGDTIDVWLDFGFSLRQKLRLRLADINAYEMNSKNATERQKAVDGKDYVHIALFTNGDPNELVIKTRKTKKGKERQTFGRYVAEVYYRKPSDEEWRYLNEELVDEGLAVWSKG